jgi:hypothetical protein
VIDIEFVDWLINRLVYKYGHDKNDDIISSLLGIKSRLHWKPVEIKDIDLDQIIGKYFIDFNLDKLDEIKIGYSEEDRQFLRSSIRSIVSDIINMTHNKGI